jgi:hypothetical protein
MRIFYLRYNIYMINDLRKIPKLKVLSLYKNSFLEWKDNFNNYTKIALVVAMPVAIINAFQTNGYLGDYGLTTAIAWTFTFVSLIYFAIHSKNLKDSKLATIYTSASSRFLQYLGTNLILAIFALPFFLSLFGLFLSLPIFNLPPVVFLPLSILSFLLSSYLLARFGMTQIVVVADQYSVIESFKKSTELTKKNRWRIFFATFLLILTFLIALTGIQFVLGLKMEIAQNQIISSIVYIIEASFLAPIFFIFQAEMYKELNGKK